MMDWILMFLLAGIAVHTLVIAGYLVKFYETFDLLFHKFFFAILSFLKDQDKEDE